MQASSLFRDDDSNIHNYSNYDNGTISIGPPPNVERFLEIPGTFMGIISSNIICVIFGLHPPPI